MALNSESFLLPLNVLEYKILAYLEGISFENIITVIYFVLIISLRPQYCILVCALVAHMVANGCVHVVR